MQSAVTPNMTQLLSTVMTQGIPGFGTQSSSALPTSQITGFALVPIYADPVAQEQAFSNLLSSLHGKSQKTAEDTCLTGNYRTSPISPTTQSSAFKPYENVNSGPDSSEESTPPSTAAEGKKKVQNKRPLESNSKENSAKRLPTSEPPNFVFTTSQDKSPRNPSPALPKFRGIFDDFHESPRFSRDRVKTEMKSKDELNFGLHPQDYPEYISVLDKIMSSSLRCRIKNCRTKPHSTYAGTESHLLKHFPFPTIYCSRCETRLLISVAEQHAVDTNHGNCMEDDRGSMVQTLLSNATKCYPTLFLAQENVVPPQDDPNYLLDDAFRLKNLANRGESEKEEIEIIPQAQGHPYAPKEQIEGNERGGDLEEADLSCVITTVGGTKAPRKASSANAIDSNELEYDPGTQKPTRYLEKLRRWIRATQEGAPSCFLCPEANLRQDISKAEAHLFSHVRKMETVLENLDTKKIAYECGVCGSAVSKVSRHRKTHKDMEVRFKDLRPYIEPELLSMIDQCCPAIRDNQELSL